jgi:hypothetical protein
MTCIISVNPAQAKHHCKKSGSWGGVVVDLYFNPILHTVWLDSHALTLKNYTAKYYQVRKIWFFAYLTNFLSSIEENCSHVYIVFYCYNMSVFFAHSLNVWQISHHLS